MVKTLIVTQCCKRKNSTELFDVNVSILDILNETKNILIEGRKEFKQYIYGTKEVTALSLYDGLLYSSLDKMLVYEEFMKNKIDFIIISAAYGIVHAFEKIRKYDLEMSRSIAKQWLKIGLPRVFEEYIAKTNVEKVYGFFTKNSMYTKVFTNVNLNNIGEQVLKYVLVYPENCRGGSNSLRELGYSITHLIRYKALPKKTKYCKKIVVKNML
ncbi:MAG: hypothetical protein B6U76_04860 [Desulfurococcales archaeon ex4484_217_2]|nr:MAG: hypothetical protein B6U76_04860 [Desulfurococcales archaeon ex4484_217_2]